VRALRLRMDCTNIGKPQAISSRCRALSHGRRNKTRQSLLAMGDGTHRQAREIAAGHCKQTLALQETESSPMNYRADGFFLPENARTARSALPVFRVS
jgi:hypothetical protein